MGIVMADLDALLTRLEGIAPRFTNTAFSFARRQDRVDVTCPWGNRFRVHRSIAGFGDSRGIAYLDSPVPPGAVKTIAEFYSSCMGAPSQLSTGARGGAFTKICVGPGQRLVYRESKQANTPYDGHHIAVYVADFSGPYAWLSRRDLVSSEDNEHQYRFETLVGPRGRKAVWQLEHEIRSLHHPLWQRSLVNREAT